MAGVPIYAVPEAELGHWSEATLQIAKQKKVSFQHKIGHQPGHRSSAKASSEVSALCPVHLCQMHLCSTIGLCN